MPRRYLTGPRRARYLALLARRQAVAALFDYSLRPNYRKIASILAEEGIKISHMTVARHCRLLRLHSWIASYTPPHSPSPRITAKELAAMTPIQQMAASNLARRTSELLVTPPSPRRPGPRLYIEF